MDITINIKKNKPIYKNLGTLMWIELFIITTKQGKYVDIGVNNLIKAIAVKDKYCPVSQE